MVSVKPKTIPKQINCKECDKPCPTGKRGLCAYHYSLYLKKKESVKKKKEKKRIKVQKKRETITEKKLDSLVSKVIRTLYGDKCVTCGNIGSFNTNHCGHAISRQFRATRFNPENLGTQCPRCNLYLQGAQYEYGKFINVFHGPETMEKLIKLSKSNIKIGLVERKELWEIYEDALEHKDLKRLIQDYYEIVK